MQLTAVTSRGRKAVRGPRAQGNGPGLLASPCCSLSETSSSSSSCSSALSMEPLRLPCPAAHLKLASRSLPCRFLRSVRARRRSDRRTCGQVRRLRRRSSRTHQQHPPSAPDSLPGAGFLLEIGQVANPARASPTSDRSSLVGPRLRRPSPQVPAPSPETSPVPSHSQHIPGGDLQIPAAWRSQADPGAVAGNRPRYEGSAVSEFLRS